MRLFALAVALAAATLATAAPASAQTDDIRHVLRLTIITGDDDLRGGRDSVRGSYRFGETWSTPVLLNRRGMRWPDRSRNTADIPLAPIAGGAGPVFELRLQTSFGGGIGGDNWNMDQLHVQLCALPPAGAAQCADFGSYGPRRFTASDGTYIVRLTRPAPTGVIK